MKRVLLIAVLSIFALIALAILLGVLLSPLDFNFSGQVAVIPIKGEISSATGMFSDSLTSGEIVERIEQANNDPSIGVVFFDIDSPGGSVVATKQIVYKVRSLEKPSVAYIGELGASGAYYIAAATDYVVADPDSLTGSIGVISIVPNIEDLLADLGVKVEVLKGGRLKSIGGPFKEMNNEEKEILQTIIDDVFTAFKADILEFRKDRLDEGVFNGVADGRILSGRQALAANLIDQTGTKEDAIDKAAELAGITGEPMMRHYPKQESNFFDLFASAGYAFASGFGKVFSQGAPVIRA